MFRFSYIFMLTILVFLFSGANAADNKNLIIMPPEYDYAKTCLQDTIPKTNKTNWSRWDGRSTIKSERYMFNAAKLYKNGSSQTPKNYALAARIFKYLGGVKSLVQGKAKLQYARLMLSGNGVTQDRKKAKKLLDESAELGARSAYTELGSFYIDAGEYKKAEDILKRGAVLGHPFAAMSLYKLYYDNLVTPPSEQAVDDMLQYAQSILLQNLESGICQSIFHFGAIYQFLYHIPGHKEASVAWMKKASSLDNVRAKVRMAEYYRTGWGVKFDMKEAVRLWKEAAELGSEQSIHNIAESYLSGDGVDKQDVDEAIKWLERSAIRGHGESISLLIDIYDGKYSEDKISPEKALHWLEYSQKLPNASAGLLVSLADLYVSGKGGKVDHEKAFKLYSRAASLGNRSAIEKTGNAYRYGIGVKQDPVKALRFYRHAYSLGSNSAAKAMEQAYKCEIGKKESKKNAEKWFDRALFRNSETAVKARSLQLENDGTEPALKERFNILKRASINGSRKSMILLSLSYFNGNGIEKDDELANLWMNRALADGEGKERALIMLAKLKTDAVAMPEVPGDVKQWMKEASVNKPVEASVVLAKWYKNMGNMSQYETYLKSAVKSGDISSIREYANYKKDSGQIEEAHKLFEVAANAGDIKSMVELAKGYTKGGWVGSDIVKAEKWLKKAESSYPCDVKTRVKIANAYHKFTGDKEKEAKASYWLKKAENISKNSGDNIVITKAYISGIKGDKSKQEMMAQIMRAADSGNHEAIFYLAERYLKRVQDEASGKLAVYWLKRAAELGDAKSMRELSRLYAAGLYVDISARKSEFWLSKAAEMGDAKAILKLKLLRQEGYTH